MVGRKALNQFEFFVDLPRFDNAKCADVEDKDLFFPDNRTQEAERLHQLKAICSSCIHEKECLEYALEKQIPYGIWGGSTPADRDTVRLAATEQGAAPLHQQIKDSSEGLH